MPDLRKILGLPVLELHPEMEVLLTFSPAAATAANNFELGYVCVTFPRGVAPGDIDWSPLSERLVMVWPDTGATEAAGLIAAALPDAIILSAPDDTPDGWNLAQAASTGWTPERVKTHIAMERQRLAESFEKLRRGAGDNGHGPPGATGSHEDVPHHEGSDDPLDTHNTPFLFLGHDHGEFKYLSRRAQQITSLTAQGHAKLNLMTLANLDWWEATFPGKEGAAWSAAVNWMLDKSLKMPVFNPSRARGRGCWIDNGRVVFHAGNRILADNQEFPLSDFPTEFIYEKGQPVAVEGTEPLSSTEASKFLTLCEMLPWEMPIYARFLAGWCALAPICGSLNWRPHIWLTGSAGTGKSTAMTSIVAPAIGSFSEKFLGATTEAGIRQRVRMDAMPVIMDEAESENQRSQIRMQGILELIRQASSETGGVIAKGTTTGEATMFNVRSCFCLSSIGVSATSRPDASRITTLTLEKRRDRGAFEKLVEFANVTSLNPAYCASLRARTMSQIPVILHNAQQFIKAATIRLGDARAGDQIGTLIAGAFSLTSMRKIDLEFARGWIDEQNWSGFEPDAADSDENLALARLLQAKLRVDNLNGAPWTTSIGDQVAKFYSTDKTSDEAAVAVNLLRLNGMRIDAEGLAVSNTHASIADVYKDSQWAGKWRDQLSRIPGAVTSVVIKFNNAANRAVMIPKRQLL